MAKFLLLGGTALLSLSAAALAEDAPAAPAAAPSAAPAEIVVTADVRREAGTARGDVTILSGAELTRELKSTIGDTLAHQPGVSATSFGPNASRPVLRGFQADRVQVLTDGIGSIDVSNTSVDHAVIIDPLLAERVDVVRGPSALLYGSSAISGLVDVLDKRIPRQVPPLGYHLDAIGTYGSAADDPSLGAAADVAVGSKVVLHADGSYAKSGNLAIGGHALTRERRAEALATAGLPVDPTVEEPIDYAASAAIDGKLPNSFGKTWTAGAGAAIITGTGNLGVSYSHYDSLYGVPVRYATQPGEGQEAPRLDVKQDRVDMRAEVDTGGGLIEAIRFRGGAARYRHFELEEDGSIGTAFYNRGLEGRVELGQAKRGGWLGTSGVQYATRDFNVVGDEAFLPRSETGRVGIFTVQQLDYGAFKAEAGLRYEHEDAQALPQAGDPRFFAGRRSFGAVSGSASASYEIVDGWRIGANLSRTERAPSAEELFANGAHGGTQAYELGNPDFKVERAYGAEVSLRGRGEGYSVSASAYRDWFSHYIYDSQTDQAVCDAAAAPSGRVVDLPCFASLQGRARYYGFEAEGTLDLARVGGFKLVADALGDYTHAQVLGFGPAPRIPPLRLLGGIEAQSDRVQARGEVEWVDDQRRVTGFETPTEGYTMVNASLSFKPIPGNETTSIVLAANNIFDVVARRHASFLKDFAPLPGRDLRVTARVAF